ncbi:MAG: V-type ATPase 116kDa subunit family protein [Treponema sp.]
MIVPMKRVSLVILEREKFEVLTKLRKLGVVHLDRIEGTGEKLAALKENNAGAVQTISILSEIKLPKNTKSAVVPELNDRELVEKCAEVISLTEQKKSLFEEISSDASELERFEKWGSVNPDDFSYLAGKGISLVMYEIPADKYGGIDKSIDTILVNSGKKDVRFLLLSKGSERPEGLPPEAFEVPVPRCSTEDLEVEIERDKKRINDIEGELTKNTVYIDQITTFQTRLEKEIEFENVYSGMEKESPEKETSLAWISGYVPVDSFENLKAAATKNEWALASADPEQEDDPPTKLRNNKLVSLIYPLTDFLGTVPGYREFDISGWFLLFFTIFFGMIFGDGGYGLLIVSGALALIFKTRKNTKTVNSGLKLLLLLGLATVAWGTITCTWFGLTMEQIPGWLKMLSIPSLSSAYTQQFDGVHSLLTTDQNLQIFCFTLALIQLSVAHLKCIVRDSKSLKCIGDLGALFMLWGMFYVVLMLVVSGTIFSLDKIVAGIPVGTVALALIGGGFVMNFVFSNYDGSIGKSILESCKNIISVILGVVNVFSDIVSYIRLWAVALAGSAISNTVNQMAGPMWGHAVLFLAFVVLLVFGHGLNIMLNVLSVIVHGVRLNTLEFSSHLGMAWSGYKYQPFSESANN